MKKKGFTLIELLAVIVILAIIALIATPLVLKYIEKSRKESKVDSAYSFVRNLETEIANFSIKNNGKKYSGQPTDKGYYELTSFENSEIDTTVKGDKPNSIKICLSSLGQVEKAMLEYGKYYVSYDGKKGSISDKDTYDNFSCSGSNDVITEEAGLYDSNNNLLYTWDELVNDYGFDIIYIDIFDENGNYKYGETDLPKYKFSTDENLAKGTKLVIGNSATRINPMIFVDCYNLEYIVIPESVKSIGESAFSSCTGIKEIVIPNSVTSIGAYAFVACENLTEVKLSNKMTRIEDHTFYGCANLKKVYIPKGIISIGTNAFNAAGLIEVTLPDSVTTLEPGAISGNKNLTSVTIPNSVTTIDKYALASNEKLTTINYTGTEAEWNAITFGEGWNESSPINKINYDHKIN